MSKSTRADIVRQRLIEKIISGELAPGTRLDEVDQANQFGWSRTPIREAFRQLSALGLVQTRAHCGVVVTPISPELVRDLHQAYAVIGEACVRLACRAADRRLAGMKALKSDDAIASAVHAGSGNSVLEEIGAALWCRLKQFPSNVPCLRAVASALASGDEDGAIAELGRSMSASADRTLNGCAKT